MRGRLGMLIGLGLVLGALLAVLLVPGVRERVLPPVKLPSVGQAAVGGPFTLTDHNGRRVSDTDLRGKLMLVFFGFTFCPDVCPTALQVVAGALDKLGPKAAGVTPVFISVDPERDTPEQLKSYLSSFHPQTLGLTGTVAEIEAVARAYRAYYKKVKDEKSAAGYTIDHTSILYVMGKDGKFLTHFTHASSVDALAAGLAKHL